jgi:hypothetical protein
MYKNPHSLQVVKDSVQTVTVSQSKSSVVCLEIFSKMLGVF